MEGRVKNQIIFEEGMVDVVVVEWEEGVEFVCGGGEGGGCVVEYVSVGKEVKNPKYFFFFFLLFSPFLQFI